jgi:disulfide bond formation protein DsbB
VDVEAVEWIFALLSLVGLALLAALVAAAIVELGGWARPLGATADAIAGAELWLAAGGATLATLGSRYFSEVADFVPCTLCWYQRIAMYPLVPLLLLAAWRRDRPAALYSLAIAAIGAAVAIYHYQLEWFPRESPVCSQGVPCSTVWFKLMGFASIPYLALVAFGLVGSLSALALLNERRATRR